MPETNLSLFAICKILIAVIPCSIVWQWSEHGYLSVISCALITSAAMLSKTDTETHKKAIFLMLSWTMLGISFAWLISYLLTKYTGIDMSKYMGASASISTVIASYIVEIGKQRSEVIKTALTYFSNRFR